MSIIVKIIRADCLPGGLRVVKVMAILPKTIRTTCRSECRVWPGQFYYKLQRLCYWNLLWIDEEESMNQNEWDFKWSDAYLKIWK